MFTETSKPTQTTDYLGGYQYSNQVLQFFPTAEGYVKHLASAYSYVYNYTDHLGNIRLSYTQNNGTLEVLEENHYYPFGLKHAPTNANNQPNYKYKFQGQELQDELELGWYSYKWRNYNPAIGRFMSIDPLTEKYEDYTPYQFSSNQPVHAKELEGLESSNDLNKNKPTPTQRAYNSRTGNTDLLKVVVFTISDALQSLNTYTGNKKENPSNKDIGSTATSKNGGGENEKTTGKKKGDNIDADAFTTATPGGAKTGNKYKSGKDFVEAMNDILGGIDAGWKNAENGTEYVQELKKKYGDAEQSEFVTVVNDPNNSNNNVQIRRDVYEAQQKKEQEQQKKK